MSIESTEPSNSKLITWAGIVLGLINALIWIILGPLLLPMRDSNISVWWVLFCLILNIGVSFAVSQQHGYPVRRLFWIVGITLFTAIFCAFILGFWASYGVTDWGGLVFLGGAGQGGLIGLIIGFIVGTKTSPSKISSINFRQGIGAGIVTSTVVGIAISAIGVIIFAISVWLKDFVDSPNYPDLTVHVFWNVLLITPLGAIPSVITGITTSFAIHAINWWLKKKNTVLYNKVG